MNDPTNDLNPTRLRIGGLRGTDESVHLDLTGNTYIWGQKGSGTSTLVRRILAGAAPTNRITWVIDPHNFEETRPFLTPMIDGDGPAPPFDWVAGRMDEAAIMTRQAVLLAEARQRDSLWFPRLLIVVAAGADEFVLDNLAKLAEIGPAVGINVVIAAKRPPGVVLTAGLLRSIGRYVAVGDIPERDAKAVFGDAAGPLRRGQALVGDSTGHVVALLDRISPDQISELAAKITNSQPELDEAGQTQLYISRWLRTLPLLFPEAPIPSHLARLGLPEMPTSVATATPAQLTHALNMSPSALSPAQTAATELLINACGGQLLRNTTVRQTMAIDGGALYVRWSDFRRIGYDVETDMTGTRDITHPDAAIILRLIGHLGTGGLTDPSVQAIMSALEETYG